MCTLLNSGIGHRQGALHLDGVRFGCLPSGGPDAHPVDLVFLAPGRFAAADAGYNAHQVKDAVARSPGLRLEIVKRTDDIKGFVVLPRRWVVERTFSWFGRNRRLAKDYQNLAETLAAFITLAAIQFAIRRLARR